ncbi:MAG: steroid 3-ketoacyl-CoA thiolase [Actinobacteria bacterium]|nr:steroid 3-ketoacyl-CoA thiolase [Actinomycetota bacterium]
MDAGHDSEAVIVEAVRTPIGRRGGALARWKPVALLRHVLAEVMARAGMEPSQVEQVVGGCVTQVGEQGLNVTRNAWLAAGWDVEVGCTTVDVSCGSAQQANHVVASLVAAGAIDIGIACGVESMSRVGIGTNAPNGVDEWKTDDYPWDDPPGVQFGGAERIAARQGYTRRDLDEFGALSYERAERAWAEGRFRREVAPLDGPAVARDEGVRPTTTETLAGLRPVMRRGLHTAGTSSQVSDGACAVLWTSRRRAAELGLRPRARLLAQVVTGADPYYLLDGPVVATRKALERTGMSVADIDLFEVNEAFASVVLNWLQQTKADLERTNVNGGAIALGHPLGATGARLLTTALHELERTDGGIALVAMCCGGSLGTASILERL